MLTEVTTAAANGLTEASPMGERMALGLRTIFLGLGTVFAVLIILMIVLFLFRLFFYTIPNRKKAGTQDSSSPAPAEASGASEDDGALVAAITAAVAAYLDAEAENKGEASAPSFRVVNFRRKK